MNLNKAIIAGRLTQDPVLKSTNSGTKVCSFSIATNNIYKKDGEKIEETDYHNCVAWQRLAEIVAEYMKKGQQVLVEGRIKTRSYEQEGVKKYRTEIIVSNLEMGMKPQGSSSTNSVYSQDNNVEIPTVGGDKKDNEIKMEDIPF